MKNKILILALSTALLGTTSCNDYLDVNDNPDRPALADVQPNSVFAGAVTGSYYVQARRVNIFSSLMTNSFAGNSHSYGTPYMDEYTPNITSSFYSDIWDQMYRSMVNFQMIIDYNDPSGDFAQYKAMAKIMKAYYMQMLTDFYGNAPYTEAWKRLDNSTPKYDKSEDIYKANIAELENAISLIDAKGGKVPSTDDIVFAGSMAKWKAFANTIKLRHLLRMSNVTGEMASYRDAKLATLAGQTFTDANVLVNPGYDGATADSSNPFNNYVIVTPAGTRPGNYTLVVPSEHIALALSGNAAGDTRDMYQKFNGIVDGRSNRMFTFVGGKIEGVRQGATPGQPGAPSPRTISRIGSGIVMGTTGGVSVKGALSKPGVLMLKSEAELLLAEAAVRYPAIFSDGKTHFENAVKASYTYLGVPDANAAAEAYITSINSVAKLGWTGSNENLIEAIITQKWLALTGVTPEQTYFDYTRTGYPVNPLPTVSTNPRPNRLPYPVSEYAANTNNVPQMANGDVFTKNQHTPFWAR